MKQKRFKGFTLIELMVALSVAAILLTIGVPNFREMLLSNALTSKVNAFVADLNFTRSEAVKRGARVTMCKSNDKAQCAVAGGWEEGWIVFVDTANPGTVDAGETVLLSAEKLNGSLTLRGNSNVTNRVSYLNSGVIGGTNGQLIFCDDRVKTFSSDKSKARVVIIGNTGRIRTVKGDDASVSLASCTPS
jgi:type IV fimbrial biogenesis protein FimT